MHSSLNRLAQREFSGREIERTRPIWRPIYDNDCAVFQRQVLEESFQRFSVHAYNTSGPTNDRRAVCPHCQQLRTRSWQNEVI
jgi:hypothetical protein